MIKMLINKLMSFSVVIYLIWFKKQDTKIIFTLKQLTFV